MYVCTYVCCYCMLFLEGCCYRPDYAVLSSIRKIFGVNWKHVGYFLGLNHCIINNIEKNFDEVEERSFNMLIKWKQFDIKSCYCKLIAALEADDLFNDAEILKSTITTSKVSTYFNYLCMCIKLLIYT